MDNHTNTTGESLGKVLVLNGPNLNLLGAEVIKDLITKGFHPASRLFTIARAVCL